MRIALPASAVVAGLVLLMGAAPAAAVETPVPACRPVPSPAADILRASDAWQQFGVDGTGVRVGIISDSFGTYGEDVVSADVAAGWLPGPGNPCGRTSPVDVVAEGTVSVKDEGRAMAQLIHGIAPGAQLLFASSGPDTNASMVKAITELRAAGVDIIVDDIGVEDDLRYQRGSAADAISDAVDAGILYVSAAGNSGAIGAPGHPSAGYPIASWETSFYRPVPCPDDVAAAALAASPDRSPIDCLDYTDDGSGDATLGLTLPKGDATSFRLDWAEPAGEVTTSFGTVARNTVTGEIRATWAGDAQLPVTRNELPGDRAEPQEWAISVVRHRAPGAGLPAVDLFFNDTYVGEIPLALEHYISTRWNTVGSSMWGHQTALDTLAVAAVDAESLTLETYSSAGPANTLFGGEAPESIDGPGLAGLDGLPISFVVGGPVEPAKFFGTSAAAPTVAAVSALVKQAAPGADPAALRAALESTARADAFHSPWPAELPARRFSGAGLVDAAAAVALVAPAPAPTPTSPPSPAPAPPAPGPTPTTAPARLAESGSDADATVVGAGALLLALGVAARILRGRAQRS